MKKKFNLPKEIDKAIKEEDIMDLREKLEEIGREICIKETIKVLKEILKEKTQTVNKLQTDPEFRRKTNIIERIKKTAEISSIRKVIIILHTEIAKKYKYHEKVT